MLIYFLYTNLGNQIGYTRDTQMYTSCFSITQRNHNIHACLNQHCPVHFLITCRSWNFNFS